MNWGWLKYAALGVAVFVVLSVAYRIGYGKAEAEGQAALAELKRGYSDEASKRWAEYADKLQKTEQEAQSRQAEADALEAALLETKTALAAERRGFAKRIADATRNSDCLLNADVVRLYNEALYGPGHAAASGSEEGAAGAPGPAPGAGSAAPFGAGLLREQPVTIKDLLAHAKLYGAWAREVHAIALGWNALLPE